MSLAAGAKLDPCEIVRAESIRPTESLLCSQLAPRDWEGRAGAWAIQAFQIVSPSNSTPIIMALTSRPTPAAITSPYPINISSFLGTNNAFVGFTAGTRSGFENHDIVNW
jgi:hypothetical protein